MRASKEARQGGGIENILRVDLDQGDLYVGESGIVFHRASGRLKAFLTAPSEKGAFEPCAAFAGQGFPLAGDGEKWRILGKGMNPSFFRKVASMTQAVFRSAGKGGWPVEKIVLPVTLVCRRNGEREQHVIKNAKKLSRIIEKIVQSDRYFFYISHNDLDEMNIYACFSRQCVNGIQVFPKGIDAYRYDVLNSFLVAEPEEQGDRAGEGDALRIRWREWGTERKCSELFERQ